MAVYDFIPDALLNQVANAEQFRAGIALYEARPDKDWSLTDCISFVMMEREKIGEALTGDHHFEQAGFIAPLKSQS